jgi:hypothetical protein
MQPSFLSSSGVCKREQKIPNTGQRRLGRAQARDLPDNPLRIVPLQNFQIEWSFTAETIIKTLPANAHRMTQVIGGSRVITFPPENSFRRRECFRPVKFFRTGHGFQVTILDIPVKYNLPRWTQSGRASPDL